VAFLNCHNATFVSADVDMDPAEAASLASLLNWLSDAGVLLLPAPTDTPVRNAAALLDHLRLTVGAPLVEAGLSAADRPGATGGPPVAVMPIWPFLAEGDDPEDRDVLLSSGRLWGSDVLIEALRVDSPDEGSPVRSVRSRYDRWMRAAGGGCQRAAIKPPGESGWYVLSAISAQA
jgi:hypothetical protein